jgi:hypothetical protein
MRWRGFLGAAAGFTMWAASAQMAGATTTTFSGTVTNLPGAEYGALVLTLPSLESGQRTTFTFEYSGGVADGGEVMWDSRSVITNRFEGELDSRDRLDTTGCSFAFGTDVPATCAHGSPYTGFLDFSYSYSPGLLTALFAPGPDYDFCALGLEGNCAAFTQFSSGFLTAFFIGETDYVVTVTTGPVPEPVTWAMLVLGFGVTGAALRARRYARA